MSTATVQQIGQDLATWLGLAQRGDTVAIMDHGQIIADFASLLEDQRADRA